MCERKTSKVLVFQSHLVRVRARVRVRVRNRARARVSRLAVPSPA